MEEVMGGLPSAECQGPSRGWPPSGVGALVLEQNNRGEQRQRGWGTPGSPLSWGGLSWEKVWGLEMPPG